MNVHANVKKMRIILLYVISESISKEQHKTKVIGYRKPEAHCLCDLPSDILSEHLCFVCNESIVPFAKMFGSDCSTALATSSGSIGLAFCFFTKSQSSKSDVLAEPILRFGTIIDFDLEYLRTVFESWQAVREIKCSFLRLMVFVGTQILEDLHNMKRAECAIAMSVHRAPP